MWTRRRLLQCGLIAGAGATLSRCVRFEGSAPPPFPTNLPSLTPWQKGDDILAETRLPKIPAVVFPVTDFGAVGDGRADSTSGILAAIAACSKAGGGRVVVSEGAWRTGALRLLSNVELNLARGARLIFSGDARQYPEVLTRYEGIECINHSPMVYAYGENNIAITGPGTLDASEANWNSGGQRWLWLDPLVAQGLPPRERVVTGKLRTSFVQPYLCNNVLIQGVTLIGSKFWQLHPTLCSHITVESVTTTVSGENTDGCNPESCDHVVIRQCTLGSGDDNIALKSGRDEDGRRLGIPCRNVVVLNCQAEGRFGFLTCGSEQTGGVQDVYAHNLWSYGQGVGNALYIKSNARRGGYTRNINLDTFRGSGLRGPVIYGTLRYMNQSGAFAPLVVDINLSNLVVHGADCVFDLSGLPEHPLGTVRLYDSQFIGIRHGSHFSNAPDVVFRNVTINGRAA